MCLLDNRNCLINSFSVFKKMPRYRELFEEQTAGNTIILGKNTWKDLLKGRPLPRRRMIVVSGSLFNEHKDISDNIVELESVSICSSFKIALQKAQSDKERDITLLGGPKIYEEAIVRQGVVDWILTVKIEEMLPGNSFFSLNLHDYFKSGFTTKALWEKDDKNLYDATFRLWTKKVA